MSAISSGGKIIATPITSLYVHVAVNCYILLAETQLDGFGIRRSMHGTYMQMY